MKIKTIWAYAILFAMVFATLFTGCKRNVQNDGKNTDDEQTVQTEYEIPDYGKFVMLSDLHNVDLEFYPGQENAACDFRIISTEELDVNKIKISFDSDIDFEQNISEDATNRETFFDYNLMLAYNGLKSKDGVSEVKGLPMEEFDKVKDSLKLYSYYVDCVFKMNKNYKPINYEDCEINNLKIEYENHEVDSEIGRIIINKDLINVGSAVGNSDFIALNCPEATYQTFYYNVNNEFSYSDMSEVFETKKNPVTLKNAKFINGQTIELSRLELEIITGDKTVNTVWEPGDELNIPAESIINVTIIGKCDKIRNQCGFKANPITEFEFESNGKTDKRYIYVSGTIYGFNKFETYAVLYDNIDIFDSYYNVLWEE